MIDLKRKQFSIDVGGRKLTLETSRIAEQATSAVIGYYGGTTVHATVVLGKKEKDIGYFPLVVDYEEKFYAAGKILGSRFVRREGRPSEEAILLGRLIDRSIRPLFDHRMRRDVHVVATILSYDGENDPDFLALMCVSTALAISEIPWDGPVGCARMMRRPDGGIIVNPTTTDLKSGFALQGFVAGTSDRINMIELESIESKESEVLETFEAASKEIKKLVDFQKKIVSEIGVKKAEFKFTEISGDLKKMVDEFLKDKLEDAIYTPGKIDRVRNIEILHEALKNHLKSSGFDDAALKPIDEYFDEKINAVVHENVLKTERRPDGRKLTEVRDLYGETGLFERTHGSALFVRGNTQALALTTLGPPGAEQTIETVEFTGTRRFMLHYNFPSYSVGETGSFRGPGRRDIGHGALAEKALRNMVPKKEDFPYAIRVVSEILSSNGSSSMATVCAGSMSMMDAGVPLKKPVAGIAMGLMTDSELDKKGKYKVLTDIQGPEDHHGDTDCKVAGTRDGVTAIQMDVKIEGLTLTMLKDILHDARTARLHILDAMEKVIASPRPELSKYAPLIVKTSVAPDKIGEVIGPGGKVINGIIDRTGVMSIDIEDDGTVFITGDSRDKTLAALREVEGIAKEYKVGEVVEGPIVKILEFGAIVEFSPNRDGMIHVSELKEGFVKKVEDVVKLGDRVKAKIIKVDNGKIGLSLKAMKGIS